MKRVFSVLFAAAMLLMLTLLPVSAAELRTGSAAAGTPSIDGKIDKVWSDAASCPIDRLKDGKKTDLTASFRALWDKDHLYLLIEVQDKDLSLKGGPSVADGVEIYLNPNNKELTNWEDDTVAQIAMSLEDPAKPAYEGRKVAIDGYSKNHQFAVEKNKDGYLVEFVVDLKAAVGFEAKAGDTMGLEVQVNDQNKGSGSREGCYGWNDDTNLAWQNPSSWGKLTLAEPKAPETGDSFLPYAAILLMAVVAGGAVIAFKKAKSN